MQDPDSEKARPTARIAIYDLDRTLTRIPTWTPFLLDTAWRRARWRLLLLPLVGGAALLRSLGVLSRDRLKEVMHHLLLGRSLPPAAIREIGEQFAERFVGRHVYDAAHSRIAADREEGYQVVMATAAYRFYAEPIASRLGISDVIATDHRTDRAGNVLAMIEGANCYGAAKLRMVEAWVRGLGLAREDLHVRFYSDHLTDLPTLEWADEAFVVNPKARLDAVARQRGWPVLSWR